MQECVRGALKNKTVLLVTHQVDFLHNADIIYVSVSQLMALIFVLAVFGSKPYD
jgi:ABC-type transport system involved in cytochrome bd biosynthesis fused ATPase/permease subunit